MSGDYFVDSCVPTLLPQHQEMLEASAICPRVIQARGYRSVKTKQELRRLGFGESQSHGVPALVIPTYKPCGERGLIQMRPDNPRQFPDGRIAKYEMPGKERLCLDVPPTVRQHIGNPKVPLLVTEGIKKGDSLASHEVCVLTLLGVTCWRGTNEHGGKTALADWADVALNNREVCIVFDSDVMRKRTVYYALRDVRDFLQNRQAKVFLIYLPPGVNGVKVGVDDYLKAGNTLQDLLNLATEELLSPPQAEGEAEEDTAIYQESETGLVWRKTTQNGIIPTPLTNFTARIVTDVTEDDGAERTRLLEIESCYHGKMKRFQIPASSLNTLNWATEHIGASATYYPGAAIKDHARFAIQTLSGEIPTRTIFAHTGWRQIGEEWVYLHAGGCIGNPPIDSVQVRLSGALEHYILPEPPTGEALIQAVRASLRLWHLGNEKITVPLLGTIYRAVLAAANFTLGLVGPTMVFKTQTAALAQQHFGATMDARNLPGSWTSTENALESLAFFAKDALLVVDDYAPNGSGADVQRLQARAERVLRAQGNNSGRARMRSDGSLRPPRPPRGLLLSTGEDVPQGKSLKARLFILEVATGDIDAQRLTASQQDASAGLYAQSMAGFLAYLAPRYGEIHEGLPVAFRTMRDEFASSTAHRRTPEQIGEIAFGLSLFLQFACKVGAISEPEYGKYWKRGRAILVEVGNAQASYLLASDPAQRFCDLLGSAIASGRAHVADAKGNMPSHARMWGWRVEPSGIENIWRPRGDCIGWLADDNLYLEKDAAYVCARQMGEKSSEGIVLTAQVLNRRLNEAGLLLSIDKKRDTLYIRKTLDGAVRKVLHLRAASILSEIPDKTDEADEDG